jgi:hypothetical protein
MNRQKKRMIVPRRHDTWESKVKHRKIPFRHTVAKNTCFPSRGISQNSQLRFRVYPFIMQCACIGKRVNKKVPKKKRSSSYISS